MRSSASPRRPRLPDEGAAHREGRGNPRGEDPPPPHRLGKSCAVNVPPNRTLTRAWGAWGLWGLVPRGTRVISMTMQFPVMPLPNDPRCKSILSVLLEQVLWLCDVCAGYMQLWGVRLTSSCCEFSLVGLRDCLKLGWHRETSRHADVETYFIAQPGTPYSVSKVNDCGYTVRRSPLQSVVASVWRRSIPEWRVEATRLHLDSRSDRGNGQALICTTKK